MRLFVSVFFLIAVHLKLVYPSPLQLAFTSIQHLPNDGCDVRILPDIIDWCDNALNRHDKLPEKTVCQSYRVNQPFWVCRNGRWSKQKTKDAVKGRLRRGISAAVTVSTVGEDPNQCTLFCDLIPADASSKKAPVFSSCPQSVTLFPTGTGQSVTHTWAEPIAQDPDGNKTSLTQISGPESPAVFSSSSSPGTSHMVSYVATDKDNMNWTCTFQVNAEIPNCPPIVHLENGNTSCSDFNKRGSNCSFVCDYGYQLNGSSSTICNDDGTWSYGENVSYCSPVICGYEPVNISHVVVSCDTDGTIDSICWLSCSKDYVLRNDELEVASIAALQAAVNETSQANTIANNNATDARDTADAAQEAAAVANVAFEEAANTTAALIDSLQTATDDLNTLTVSLSIAEADLAVAQQNVDDAIADGFENATSLSEVVTAITDQISSITNEIHDIENQLNTLTEQVNVATAAEDQKKSIADAAAIAAAETEAVAVETAEIAMQTSTAFQAAMQQYSDAVLYSASEDKAIATYARCLADGTWSIPGNPYCIDIQPPEITCISLAIVYLETGRAPTSITWNLPVVNDNSGNVTINQISGPQSGDVLDLGQYTAVYEASDIDDNTSPLCSVIINVEVPSCGILSEFITDGNLNYTCDNGFDVGSTCNFTCANNFAIEGPDYVRCEMNSTSQPNVPFWDLGVTTCNVEDCPIPLIPTNGDLLCSDDIVDVTNSTSDNETTSQCTVTCDSGYMLPYKTSYTYICEQGSWSPSEFPTACIETGLEQYAVYTLTLQYTAFGCMEDDYNNFTSAWVAILETEMTSYDTCTMGYVCSVGLATANCSDSIVTVEFNIAVTCNADTTATEETCDLGLDLMSSLTNSITRSVELDMVLADFDIDLDSDWLTPTMTDIPSCDRGKVLVGRYCERCSAGSFLNIFGVCQLCTINTYASSPGYFSCTNCPDEKVILYVGAVLVTECIDKCTVGTYSHTSYQPCVKCKSGTYQTTEGSKGCVQCPENTWTTIEGGDSIADCVAYDAYFIADQDAFMLTPVGPKMSVVFWIMNNDVPVVTVGMFDEDSNFVFNFETGSISQMMEGWDNTVTNITIETGVWIMLGIICDHDTGVVSIYKDGELVWQTTVTTSIVPDRLVLSANIGTFFSGLSVTNTLVSSVDMITTFADCNTDLPGAFFTLDGLAALNKPSIKFVPTTCKASNTSSIPDSCQLHNCQNGGVCVQNETDCYTCNCTELYGGPFCEEELVHGNWSEWMDAEGCSVTCGTGVQLKYRLCNNPPKSQYGVDCEGNSTETFNCSLPECQVCSVPVEPDSSLCDLDNEQCTITCPAGYVLSTGTAYQNFRCGLSTDYQWAPLSRLPLCTVSIQPSSYSVSVTFTFKETLPCGAVDEAKTGLESIASTLRCATHNTSCSVTVTITGCAGARRRRSDETSLVLVMTIPLTTSDATFDLPAYYASLQMTESILEAITAISILQLTVRDILDNPAQLSVTVDGIVYTVSPDNILVVAAINCGSSEVGTEGVCTQCPRGTYQTSAGGCVYCDRGTYQPEAGQTSCIPCPSEHNTEEPGARISTECIDFRQTAPDDFTDIIIITVACFLGVILVVLIIILICRFYRSSKDREKYDMEEDTISLYTDFPDIAYNVFFKRRQVLGFDENGFPVISRAPVKNGNIPRGRGSETESGEDDRTPLPLPTKEPFAYPDTDYQNPPFSYDPYDVWDDEFISPYPPELNLFDFPKIKKAIRYRVPGRLHLQNAYPLLQFGYTEETRGNSRRLLPLPIAIPIPKKLPQLMYRPPTSMTLAERLSHEYDHRDGDTYSGDHAIGVSPKTPLLSAQEGSFDHMHLQINEKRGTKSATPSRLGRASRASKHSVISRSKSAGAGLRSKGGRVSPRSKSAAGITTRSTSGKKRTTKVVLNARETLQSAVSERNSPRYTVSSISPRLTKSAGLSPRSALSSEMLSPRLTTFDEDSPHPRPSRYVVPRPRVEHPTHLPPSMVRPQKSSLKEPTQDMRPSTSATVGRKSVTIREESTITRPATVTTSARRIAVGTPSHDKPISDAKSARGTMISPNAARHTSTNMPEADGHLLSDMEEHETDEHRAKSSGTYLSTPMEHPRPVMHGGVKVQRTSDYTFFKPPPNLVFSAAPPPDHQMKFMTPPSFLRTTKRNTKSPRPAKHVWIQDTEDNIDDDGELLGSSFFLTEVPDENATPKPYRKRRVKIKSSPSRAESKTSLHNGRPPSTANADGISDASIHLD